VIVGVPVITTVAPLLSTRGRTQNAVSGARRQARRVPRPELHAGQAEREKIFARLLDEAADRWTRSGAVTTAGVTMPCGAELSACDPHQIVLKDVLQKDISE
jgi:hypothetical protein